HPRVLDAFEVDLAEAGAAGHALNTVQAVEAVTDGEVVVLHQLLPPDPPEQPVFDAEAVGGQTGEPEVVPQVGGHAEERPAFLQQRMRRGQERVGGFYVLEDVDGEGDVEAFGGGRSP